MKRFLPIIVIVALALTLVPLALAGAPGGGGWKRGKEKFNLVGTVAPKSVVADAKVRLLTGDEAVAIALAEVPVGAKVKARGTIDRTDPEAFVFTARDLKVKAPAGDETLRSEEPPAPAASPGRPGAGSGRVAAPPSTACVIPAGIR